MSLSSLRVARAHHVTQLLRGMPPTFGRGHSADGIIAWIDANKERRRQYLIDWGVQADRNAALWNALNDAIELGLVRRTSPPRTKPVMYDIRRESVSSTG